MYNETQGRYDHPMKDTTKAWLVLAGIVFALAVVGVMAHIAGGIA